MKILQITNKVPVPPKDGGSIASFRLTEGLVEKEHDVHILAMNTSKHFVHQDIIKTFEKPGLRITPIWMNTRVSPLKALSNLLFSKIPYNAARFISSDFREKLLEVLSKIKPELIILENLYPAAYLDDIRKVTSATLVYRAHNIEHEIWQRTADNASGMRKWYLGILAKRIKRFEKGIINRYDLLTPITQRDAEALTEMGNNKPCFVLPTGYHHKISEYPPMDIKTPEIAHLGALDWLPNQEGILWFIDRVWPLLRESNPKIEFHIAGRNAPEWFEKRLNIEGVKYYGEIDDAEEFIKSHPIHIVPLFSGSGMRIKIVEAMAYGRAVVTTTLGTEGIDTEHKTNIIIADSVNSFKENILQLVDNNTYCHDIGKNAFTFVKERLNNEKLVSGFLDFVGKAL